LKIKLIIYTEVIDYKNSNFLKKFITIQGKILPRHVTKVNAKQHRSIVKAT
jgi:ribosomal protein S18